MDETKKNIEEDINEGTRTDASPGGDIVIDSAEDVSCEDNGSQIDENTDTTNTEEDRDLNNDKNDVEDNEENDGSDEDDTENEDAEPVVEPEESPSFANTAKSALTVVIVLIAICMMVFTVVSVTTFDQSDRTLFGYRAYIVRSDSMSKTDFKAGDLILSAPTDPKLLKEGDIVSFKSQDKANYGDVVTHKIRFRTFTDEGKPAFITYGTTTDTNDPSPVLYENVLGKYQMAIPGIGNFFVFLKTPAGYAFCILLPFLLLIGIQGYNTLQLWRQYRREREEDLRKQKRELEDEKDETAKMREELEQLRAEMKAMKENAGSKETDLVREQNKEDESLVSSDDTSTMPVPDEGEDIERQVSDGKRKTENDTD